MSVITRRRFVAGALAATTTPVFARVARAQTAAKIGTAVLGDYSMAGPVIVALEQGFFKAENPRDAADLVSKKLGWTPEAVLGAHKISGPLLPVDGQINAEALAAMQETLLEYGLIKKKLPIGDHYTREFTPVRV
jgi:ABC-type nitrate/sulfonate/bicarbonate transport system substrate-binding protein